MTSSHRRVAVISNAATYVGPPLAVLLAQRDHDLVIGDPEAGLVDKCIELGARVVAVDGVADLAKVESSERLLEAAMSHFGRVDSATAFSGRVITGRFLNSTEDDLDKVVNGCLTAPYHFLKVFTAQMVDQREGQILLLTSAAGNQPTFGAPLYSSARAAATMLMKNVALEVVRKGVQVNAIGTNFMDFPEFLRANGVTDAASRAKVEAMVPMGRLGTVEECAALCAAFVDGTSRFQTGQFVSYAGGW